MPTSLAIADADVTAADRANIEAMPRTVGDITAILEQEKPDPARIAAAERAASAAPPAGLSGSKLVTFFLDRGNAASEVGRDVQALADFRTAYTAAWDGRDRDIAPDLYSHAVTDLARLEGLVGHPRVAADLQHQEIDFLRSKGLERGTVFGAYQNLALQSAQAGDFSAADAYLQRLDELKVAAGGWRKAQDRQQIFAAIVDRAHGQVLATAGKDEAAIPYFRRAAVAAMQAEADSAGRDWPAPGAYVSTADLVLVDLAYSLGRTGHVLDAELSARRALVTELHLRGRFSTRTAAIVLGLAQILNEEGRYPEAEKLVRAALDIYRTLNFDQSSTWLNRARAALVTCLVAEARWAEATAQLDEIQRGLAGDPYLRVLERQNVDFAIAEVRDGRGRDAVDLARRTSEERARIFGDNSYGVAEATGIYATALLAVGDKAAARDAFGRSVPMLLAHSRQAGDEGRPLVELRLRVILEAYLGLLASEGGAQNVDEAFRIAGVAHGRSVQHALAEATVRGSVTDPALADLIRRQQDALKQAAARTTLLANAYALPPDQRDDAALGTVRAAIDGLDKDAAQMGEEIKRRFPDYARLIDPPPATVADMQAALQPGEALFAVYVTSDRTYLWAVPKAGSPQFAVRSLSRADIARMAIALRRSLDPSAATLADIPPYDLKTAYKLYAELLEPVKSGWTGANQLLVVPHDALAELPFALLTTASSDAKAGKGDAVFANYRQVPWLIRQLAVTQLPSVASLATLRRPSSRPAAARPFIGFGDPWFSAEEAAEAARETPSPPPTRVASAGTTDVAMRGLRIRLRSVPRTETMNSAQLSMLPRLPETADEVREVAVALKADPQTDVFLGLRANERTVETTPLDDRRVVMFATHGLVPGDLDGLNEPALALTDPRVAHVDGTGLLTVGKILGLRLNADWVVLSACNTAAGDGAGAEAVSGLGLAFFYAGSRALLVSNWPVETNAARQLTTELFRREAATPGMARSEALRQAMLSLIDGPGRTDPATGRTLFSYAHPIFWAPFSLVGDGGGRHGN